jgi:hypothetical protein
MSLKEKLCGSDSLCSKKNMVNSINRFFFKFDTPYTFTALVGSCMLGGLIGLMLANRQCTTVSTTNQAYGNSYGYGQNHRMFFNTLLERPADLKAEVTRTTDVCLLATVREAVYKYTTPRGGEAWESHMKTCILGTPQWFEAHNWPTHLRFCTTEELMTEVKKGFTRYEPDTGVTGCRVGTDVNCVQKSPWEFQVATLDRDFPGWGCSFVEWNKDYETKYDCANNMDFEVDPQTYKDENGVAQPINWFNCFAAQNEPVNHRYEWIKWDEEAKSGAGRVWTPSNNGGVAKTSGPASLTAWTMYYQVTITDSEEICPSWILAFTAAMGFIPYVETIATLLVCGALVLMGFAKPIKEGTTVMTLLKDAGLSEVLDDMTTKLSDLAGNYGGKLGATSLGGTQLGSEEMADAVSGIVKEKADQGVTSKFGHYTA